MKNAPYVIFGLLAALPLQPVLADAILLLSADTPSATVMPRKGGRAPLLLPDLEYQFDIEASCRNDLTPASLSLAVADTQRIFNLQQTTSSELQQVRLRIPAAQIAPVVIADFCVAKSGDADLAPAIDPRSPLTVRAALSAQASLLCLGDNIQAITYASAVLDILLVCTPADTAAGVPAE